MFCLKGTFFVLNGHVLSERDMFCLKGTCFVLKGLFCLKGTVNVISSDLLFIEWNVRLTTVNMQAHSKRCMIQIGTTCNCNVYVFIRTVQPGLSGVKSTQHVFCNKCNLARSQCKSSD